jgi:hypothetical protein
MYETRLFDPEIDSYMVLEHSNAPPAPDHLVRAISVVPKEVATQLWRDVIARRWRPLTRFLPPHHWSRQFDQFGPDWETAWNAWISGKPEPLDPVRTFLSGAVSWKDSDSIYFVISGQSIFCLPWSMFLRHWYYFLHGDQDALVLVPTHSQFICFGETGTLWVGSRPLSPQFDECRESPDCGCQQEPPSSPPIRSELP